MMIPDAIHRLNAALEARYRIERELGAGGMATVYLAAVQHFFEELERLMSN